MIDIIAVLSNILIEFITCFLLGGLIIVLFKDKHGIRVQLFSMVLSIITGILFAIATFFTPMSNAIDFIIILSFSIAAFSLPIWVVPEAMGRFHFWRNKTHSATIHSIPKEKRAEYLKKRDEAEEQMRNWTNLQTQTMEKVSKGLPLTAEEQKCYREIRTKVLEGFVVIRSIEMQFWKELMENRETN